MFDFGNLTCYQKVTVIVENPNIEIRNPKQIQNSNLKCSKPFFHHLNFGHSDLFRASCFGFRILNLIHLPAASYSTSNFSTFTQKNLFICTIIEYPNQRNKENCVDFSLSICSCECYICVIDLSLFLTVNLPYGFTRKE